MSFRLLNCVRLAFLQQGDSRVSPAMTQGFRYHTIQQRSVETEVASVKASVK